jgi:trehalose 6-phosphate synthase/phosphatase
VKSKLIIASNRLPIRLTRENDRWMARPGSGGLVTALVPVLSNRGGAWLGWPGVVEEDGVENLDDLLADLASGTGYDIHPVSLTRQERRDFYFGFSNEIIWPIFHDLQTLCNFDPRYWDSYLRVNRKFARAIEKISGPDDYVWIHDYHLMAVGWELKQLGIESPCGFFLHIPFPPLDIFLKIPWRLEIVRMLLAFDLIGLQTDRDRRNFLECIEQIVPDAQISGDGAVISVRLGEREVRVGSFPIGIDFNEFDQLARSQAVADSAWYIHENIPDRQIILGVDRLDYTKGIPYRLDGFRNALVRHPELRGKVSFVQVVVPSRTDVPEYQRLREEIERMVSEINGEFSRSGWIPVHYHYRNLDRTELLGYYRAAEIALVTPLKDGMNLIAKEYCASNFDERGTLILSEFAGAAPQLQEGALMVNPCHIDQVADAIHHAYVISDEEKQRRMRHLRNVVKEQDIFWWVDSFLRAAISKSLDDFPVLGEYLPRLEVDEAHPTDPDFPLGGTFAGPRQSR